MEEWEHMTAVREVIREDSSIEENKTRVEGAREEIEDQREVSNV